jgi:hypothetical protein
MWLLVVFAICQTAQYLPPLGHSGRIGSYSLPEKQYGKLHTTAASTEESRARIVPPYPVDGAIGVVIKFLDPEIAHHSSAALFAIATDICGKSTQPEVCIATVRRPLPA